MLTAATARLAAAGVPSARVDAELIAASVLGTTRSRLALSSGFTPIDEARFDELVSRRVAREPVQHLTGSAPFRYLELAVGPGVFVPRPETEVLAGMVVDAVRAPAVDAPAGDAPTVVDLCSGSGAVALAVAHEVPGARVVAVERSTAALAWLRRNAATQAAAGDRPIEVVGGDVTDPGLLAELTGRVDVVVCNPPYVPEATPVPPEVAGHDPAEAVFGGPDGLAVIRPVVGLAATLLRAGGLFAVEHDDSHAAAVGALIAADRRFVDVTGHRDLAGRPRFGTARRAAPTAGTG
ncbi:peptide chain release factor N(5)-glutamine methyltransferase [Solwaraspora sp. WMMA2056]|uniref:peptide chain release factor N(5)-glutamine methyltransferase n=1 Tax=Solwaraspora sp. WMMA2056 TaxID=3015161 RepID=UPI00259AFCC9|nr:peptide chain release factor N(5)-glutamine methyltransferase [Solwaraspora sp. WMMA2056]WJK42914.1 peptide chain release factor N(5)-glutamine methyltransferase [Solwaraspora sp. WMMA2056]